MVKTGISLDSVKNNNKSQILKILQKNGAMSRKDIANQIGLTPAAVTMLCNDMMEAHMILEKGEMKEQKRAGRYQQHQNRCHYRDKQRIHKRSYVIQFLKRILIVFKCECSFRRKSQHICKNPLGRLKRIHNQNINRKQKNASKNKSCYSISDFFLHYISTSLRFVITNCVTPIPATIIRKTIAFACAKPNSFAPKAEL